jgi:hypothetical protein
MICFIPLFLQDLEEEGRTHIAGWVYNGRAFAIHDPDIFVKECIPKYFKMTSLSSFQRQLNLYDFHRVPDGPHQGAYFHKLFIQGHAVLSTKMVRNKVIRAPKTKKSKKVKKKAKKMREKESSDEESGTATDASSNGDSASASSQRSPPSKHGASAHTISSSNADQKKKARQASFSESDDTLDAPKKKKATTASNADKPSDVEVEKV